MIPTIRHPKTTSEKRQLVSVRDELKEEGFTPRNREKSRVGALPTLHDDIFPSILEDKKTLTKWCELQRWRFKSSLQATEAPEKIERELPSSTEEAILLAKKDKQVFSEIPSEIFGLSIELFEAYQEEFLS